MIRASKFSLYNSLFDLRASVFAFQLISSDSGVDRVWHSHWILTHSVGVALNQMIGRATDQLLCPVLQCGWIVWPDTRNWVAPESAISSNNEPRASVTLWPIVLTLHLCSIPFLLRCGYLYDTSLWATGPHLYLRRFVYTVQWLASIARISPDISTTIAPIA